MEIGFCVQIAVCFVGHLAAETGKPHKSREICQSVRLCKHPPSPFQPRLLPEKRRATNPSRPDIQTAAKPRRHPNRRKKRQIAGDPFLLRGIAETERKHRGAAGADDRNQVSVFLTVAVKVAPVCSRNRKGGEAPPQIFRRARRHAVCSAAQKDPLAPRGAGREKRFSEVDSRNPPVRKGRSQPRRRAHNRAAVRQNQRGARKQALMLEASARSA